MGEKQRKGCPKLYPFDLNNMMSPREPNSCVPLRTVMKVRCRKEEAIPWSSALHIHRGQKKTTKKKEKKEKRDPSMFWSCDELGPY